jgi:hypothetical protein
VNHIRAGGRIASAAAGPIGAERDDIHDQPRPGRVGVERSLMPYTYKSLAFVWLVTLGLFSLTATGVVAGSWLLLFLVVALATPALILRSPQHAVARAARLDPVGVIAKSRRRSRMLSYAGDQSRLDPGLIDVYRWENEGGAPRT